MLLLSVFQGNSHWVSSNEILSEIASLFFMKRICTPGREYGYQKNIGGRNGKTKNKN